MTGSAADKPRLPPAYRLIALDRVGSTNDEAKRLARGGAEEGTLVWAREQTAGRGRRGREWASPPGNLYFSLILRPDVPLASAAQLSFVAALGLGDALGGIVQPLVALQYKWPNDLLLNARKVAGILLEAEAGADGSVEWLVLGVGVNVASHPPDTPYPVTSLHEEGSAEATAADLLERFSRHFMSWVDRWLEDGFEPVRAAWRARARGIGETITIRLEKQEFTGVFKDLDRDGVLLLAAGGELRRIPAGEVFFGGASSREI
jgi:BirA family biotin operon repressor/biotin-[acetyl-CoA-carboxylase] ligase